MPNTVSGLTNEERPPWPMCLVAGRGTTTLATRYWAYIDPPATATVRPKERLRLRGCPSGYDGAGTLVAHRQRLADTAGQDTKRPVGEWRP